MATLPDSLSIRAALSWEQESANGAGRQPTRQGPDAVSYDAAPSAATYTEVLVAQFTLAASASQTLNLNSFATLLGATATCTKALGFLVKATNAALGGQLKIEPGATSAFDCWLSGTSPAVNLSCGDPAGPGCAWLLADGMTRAVSSSAKNVKFSNPGTQAVAVSVAFLCGA